MRRSWRSGSPWPPRRTPATFEGFRLFTSAARGMLRYRRCLRDRAAYGAIGAPLSLDDNIDHHTPGAALGETASYPDLWQSPLRGLAIGRASSVKWLTRREWVRLLNYLGGPHPGDDSDDSEAAPQEREDGDRGLAGGERFDLRFVRTLLRADAFGAAQAAIVARVRKRAPAPAAVAEAMGAATDDAYGACAASYAAVVDQLRLEALAALDALLEHGALEALVLVDRLAGRDVVRRLLALAGVDGPAALEADPETGAEPPQAPDLDEGQRAAVASGLQAIARAKERPSDGAAADLLARARAAARQVNRIGFRREDRADPAMCAAMQASVLAVVDALAELERLVASLPQAARPEAMVADRPRFDAAFRSIYGAAPPRP